jgi:molybdate transport repressor ModE-like protein
MQDDQARSADDAAPADSRLRSDRASWLGIEVRHLAALEAVAREGSFRRAAEQLGFVQSAISQQIAALERIAGQRLVERSRGGGPVALTETGELMLRHAQAILGRLRAAEADVAALGEDGTVLLRVGITESVGVRVLPELLRRFAADWPDVRLRPSEEASSDLSLYEALGRGELDLSFVELPAPPGPFETVELLIDPYVAVFRADSELAGRPLTLTDLGATPLVGHTSCRGLARVETQLRARGIEPEFAFRSDVNATIQALAGAGVGTAVLPALAIDPANELITMRELPGIPPHRLALARHADRTYSPAAEAFVAVAQSVCETIAARRKLVAVAE